MLKCFIAEYEYIAGKDSEREALRSAHLDYRARLGDAMLLAGPLLDPADVDKPVGEIIPVGTLMMYNAGSLEQAQDIAAGDPFVPAGVIRVVSVRPMLAAKGTLLAK
ncbi:MAG: YciI family protein [Spongiibacteraceae bacterium]|jgi:uncharacterized protein YciI|nr:YciI family protein [Spongiibacteraceae bacterium]